MPSSYTSLLGLVLPVQGELSGTWGDTVNNELTSLVDSAVAGTTTLSTDADVTLTDTAGTANQARQIILNCTGSRSALRTITAPARSKAYIVINNTTGGFGVKIVGVGPTTGVTIANGTNAVVVWNGSDFEVVSSGAVVGPASAVSGNIATFDGTTGKLIQDGGQALPSGTIVGTSDSQTLTNKTIDFGSNTLTDVASTNTSQTLTNKTLTDPAIIGTILEDVYTISDGAAFEIDPGNGSVQLITLGANRTPKATNFAAGEAITLMVDDGSAYTITWTDATFGGSGVVWMTGNGIAPTLNTTGYTTIVLWKVSSQVYGAKVG